MKCALCERPVCLHGNYLLSVIKEGFVSRCSFCGATGGVSGPDVFCLPTHEGLVDFSSDTYSTVCPECHGLYNERNKMNLPENYTFERLVGNAIMNAKPLIAGDAARWVAVRDTFATGPTVAIELCRAFDLDPFEEVCGVSCIACDP